MRGRSPSDVRAETDMVVVKHLALMFMQGRLRLEMQFHLAGPKDALAEALADAGTAPVKAAPPPSWLDLHPPTQIQLRLRRLERQREQE